MQRDRIATLRAQLRAETLGERRDDPLADRSRILVGERPLRRLERGRERDRLLPLSHLLAAIDVEDAQLAQLRPGRLAGGRDQIAGGNRLVDDEREILLDRRDT